MITKIFNLVHMMVLVTTLPIPTGVVPTRHWSAFFHLNILMEYKQIQRVYGVT